MIALFNVPINLENHAEVAVKTALEIIEKLKEINQSFAKDNLPHISVGIGINTGEVIVGNLGTKSRFDYTAVGDAVNLASRLEEANKFFGTTILISEFTYKQLRKKEELDLRFIGKIKVKGKKVPVGVYEVICDKKLGKEEIALFENALDFFRSSKLKEAYKIFEMLSKDFNDPVSKYYLKKLKANEKSIDLDAGFEKEPNLF